MNASLVRRSAFNRRACCPLRLGGDTAKPSRKRRSRAVQPAGCSLADRSQWRNRPDSEISRTRNANPLIRMGMVGAARVRPAQVVSTPHRKHRAERPVPVAGSPSKNGERFSIFAIRRCAAGGAA